MGPGLALQQMYLQPLTFEQKAPFGAFFINSAQYYFCAIQPISIGSHSILDRHSAESVGCETDSGFSAEIFPSISIILSPCRDWPCSRKAEIFCCVAGKRIQKSQLPI